MGNLKQIQVGLKFNHLTIIEEAGWLLYNTQRTKLVKAQCDCGACIICPLNRIKTGNTKSCGCLRAKYSGITNKGDDYKRINNMYHHMKSRCYDRNNNRFSRYGGRGIVVCEEWINDFQAFYFWAVKNGYNKGLQIDRKDNNGNYCPENCRFVTALENSRNTSRNRNIEINGVTKTIAEWAEISNIKQETLGRRVKKGWSEDKLLTPVNTKYRHRNNF